MKKYIKLILIFIFLLLFTTILNTYCKYQNNMKLNNNIAIAKWEIKPDINNKILNLVSNNTTQDYEINIAYKSEVASNYQIILSNIPKGIKVSLNSSQIFTPDNNNQIIINAGTINPSNNQINITDSLRFISTLDADNLSDYIIGIEVIFSQI